MEDWNLVVVFRFRSADHMHIRRFSNRISLSFRCCQNTSNSLKYIVMISIKKFLQKWIRFNLFLFNLPWYLRLAYTQNTIWWPSHLNILQWFWYRCTCAVENEIFIYILMAITYYRYLNVPLLIIMRWKKFRSIYG